MRRFVPRSKSETDALREVARTQRRRPQEQAAVLLGKARSALAQRTNLGDSPLTISRSAVDTREVADAA